ncbi:hypothetical protein EP331_14525 [bacterium]|nr:MAG: hypothetical protein EP331_14525 [bacterium]
MKQLHISCEIIGKDIQTVWDCMFKAEHVMNWNFASDDWHCPNATGDLRPGGIFTFTMAAKDGSFSFDFGGTYNKVEPYSYVSYALGDGRTVEVHLKEEDGLVKIDEYFEPESRNPDDMQQAGWQSILNNYKKYVESL